jgi:hypothetical protein
MKLIHKREKGSTCKRGIPILERVGQLPRIHTIELSGPFVGGVKVWNPDRETRTIFSA